VELYFRSRFFTITGDVLEGRRRFRNADIGVRRILAALEPPKPLLPRLPLRDVPQDDALLIEQMFASRRGPTIRRLWSGETLHKSSSESDYALMGDLSYWTGGDVERMIRLFLSSGRAQRAKGRRADYLVRMAQKVAV
jgi:putative DNA primase/helicase